MEATMSPLQRAFNAFLLTMPPEQLEELVKYIQDGRPQEISQPSHENEILQARLEFNTDNNNGAVIPASANTRSSTSRGKRGSEAKRRPLNNFIAFRSYYSIVFPDLTQKAKSGILRFLWQNDPFKAKWAILAKAYSIIRDDHDSNVSLESFLGLNAQFIGIIEPSRYLNVMGWQLDVDDQQQYTMARVKATSSYEADTSTNYSVNDIVKHCYTTGYVSKGNRKSKAICNGSAPVMAFATQPTLVVHKDDSIRVSGNHTIVTDVYKTNSAMEISSPEQIDDTLSPNTSDLSTVADETPLGAMEVVGTCNRPQPFPEPGIISDIDLDNIGLPGWGEENAILTYDASLHTPMMPYDQLYCDPLESYDFSRYLDI
ncbi:mating-type protein MAT alpha 1-domain-containing protein [Aspergillus alliaceus]|uniref:mating-type protein MAT alpha 1-domain-containing protein n=1 Tax=Petromyces alliaceus TaxID=209559 RepID=UPI0012A3D40A|nr:mating-type protein MAT alpha 1-domain-containing protein [Aspergillus alliaceus]KAB8236785.1 mating-type protein MAT alpha 1-domain-containing protein [Aspergillus alliaceus]